MNPDEQDAAPVADTSLPFETISNRLDLLAETLSSLLAATKALQPLADITNIYALSVNKPITVDRQGRKYLVVFAMAALTGLTASIFGLGSLTFNLAAGWNNVSFPDGAFIYGPASNVFVVATNTFYGPAV